MSGPSRSYELPIAGRAMEVRNFSRAAPGNESAPPATAEIVFSAGAAVRRYDYWRERAYNEVLVVDDTAIRMDRFKRGIPLLNTHSAWDLEDQLGVVENPKIEAGRGIATATFSRRESVAGVVQDVQDGIIRSVSVGYVRHRVEMEPPANDGAAWTYRVVDWEPMEVSLVPIPADMDSQILRSAGDQPLADESQLRHYPCEFVEISTRNITMTTPTITPEQRAEVADLCKRHNVTHLADRLQGATPDQARAAILEELVQRDQAAGGHRNITPDHFIRSNMNTTTQPGEREAILNTLIQRMGGKADGPTVRGSVIDLAERTLHLGGVRLSGGETDQQILQRAFGMSGTSDFKALLGNAVGRVLHETYDAYEPALKAVARQVNLPDFRARSIVRLGDAPSLEKVNEHGEYKYGSMADTVNTWALSTYGRIIGLTRQAIINDDLDGFADLIRKFGVSAAQREAAELVAVLTGNPKVDGVDLFSTDAGTLKTGAESTLDLSSLAEATHLLRMQRDQGGALLAQAPGVLVVPSALEWSARQLLSSGYTPTSAAGVQPLALDLVVEPRLDAVSPTAWYLVASNQRALEYGYLDQAAGVQIAQQDGFEVDGLLLKASLDFGAGWAAPVGWVKSTGSN